VLQKLGCQKFEKHRVRPIVFGMLTRKSLHSAHYILSRLCTVQDKVHS
jgi:hypothetical protein